MSLQELNDELHGREVHRRVHEAIPYDPAVEPEKPEVVGQFQTTEEWQNPVLGTTPDTLAAEAEQERKKRRYIALGLGGVALLLLLVGAAWKIHSMIFDEARVSVAIAGPKSVASAETVSFTLSYGNDNWSSLDDAVLVLTYPESFHPEEDGKIKVTGLRAEIPVGDIKSNSNGKVVVSGKFYGSKGDLGYLKATLQYLPTNVTSRLETSAQFGVSVASSPLSLELTAPQELASGQDVEYVIDYGNQSGMPFSNLRVKVDYPAGFRFVSAEPRPSEGEGMWNVGTLSGNAGNKIRIRGTLSGSRDEHKRVHARIGYVQGNGNFVVYSENERSTRIIASPLSIYQTMNGEVDATATPGDLLQYVIRYRNDGNIGVRDTIVTFMVDSPLLDYTKLSLTKGAYDPSRKMIVWKASDIPTLRNLEPGQEGQIEFSVPVRADVQASGETRNFSVRSVATIDSPDVPTPIGSNKIISSNTLIVKLSSLITLDLKGYYEDAVFPNSGPVPPVVGQTTSYTMHLRVTNSSNDIRDTRVSIVLPTGIKYTGKVSPESETVRFNERTSEIVWELGSVAAGSAGTRELVFQVSTTPDPSLTGKAVDLVKSVTFTADDLFTNKEIRKETGTKNNYLEEDKTIAGKTNQVQPAPAS